MTHTSSKNRVIKIALLTSILVHISMVTLFRIVIYFPRTDIPYYDFRIVQAPSASPSSAVYREILSVPNSDEAFERLTHGDDITEQLASRLPPIELPTLRFSELDLLRLERQSLETRSRYNELSINPAIPGLNSGNASAPLPSGYSEKTIPRHLSSESPLVSPHLDSPPTWNG